MKKIQKFIPSILLVSFFLFVQGSCLAAKLTPVDIYRLPSMPATKRFYYGKEKMQFADLRLPTGSGPFPVVILIHGGCWLSKADQLSINLKLMSPLATSLTKEGIATWNVEYRSVDQQGGGWPGTYEDVSNAIHYLPLIAYRYHLNLKKIIVLGHSTGGQLALWSVAQAKLPKSSILYSKENLSFSGVISLAGPGSLTAFYPLQGCVCGQKVITQMMHGSPFEKPALYRQASPIELLPLGVKQILITGTEDFSVPPILGQEYVAAAKKAGDKAQFIEIKGGGHFELIDPNSNAWPVVRQTVFELLKPIK